MTFYRFLMKILRRFHLKYALGTSNFRFSLDHKRSYDSDYDYDSDSDSDSVANENQPLTVANLRYQLS